MITIYRQEIPNQAPAVDRQVASDRKPDTPTENDMFWEMYQMGKIHKAHSKAGRAVMKADQMAEYLELLEDKIESLALACQSLWEILRDDAGITQQQLEAKMEEVDLRDGRKDGKLSKAADHCHSCNRKTSRRRRVCIYCGATNPTDEVFGLR